MGVDFVRLELRFGKKQVTLRGIAAIDEAQKVIDYLTTQYLEIAQANAMTRTTGAGIFHGWARERKTQFKTIPKPVLPEEQQSNPNVLESIEGEAGSAELVPVLMDRFLDSTLGTETGALGLSVEDTGMPGEEQWDREFCLQEFAQASHREG